MSFAELDDQAAELLGPDLVTVDEYPLLAELNTFNSLVTVLCGPRVALQVLEGQLQDFKTLRALTILLDKPK